MILLQRPEIERRSNLEIYNMATFNKELFGRMQTYFIQKLGVKPHKTGWLRAGSCPSCGDRGKFGVNITLGRTNCFKCAYRPRPLRLIMKLENLETLNQVFKFLGTFEQAELLESSDELLFTRENQLPESFRLLAIGNSYTAKLAQNYLKKRGFDINKLTMKGVGYCTKGKYAQRIIFPFYEKGKLVYFNAREFINTGLRFMNPNVEEFGVGKSMLIYNIDCLYVYNRTYMVESITNAETLGEKAFAIGGKIPSEYQISKLLASPVGEIIIILDPDAYWEALRVGLRVARHKKVKVVNLPRIPSKKDPSKFLDINDLGRKAIMKLVKQMSWQSYQDIYKEYIRTPKPNHFSPDA